MTTLTLTEAAALLDLAPGTLRGQIARERLAATKRAGVWFVTRAEVERYRRDVLGRPGLASPNYTADNPTQGRKPKGDGDGPE